MYLVSYEHFLFWLNKIGNERMIKVKVCIQYYSLACCHISSTCFQYGRLNQYWGL